MTPRDTLAPGAGLVAELSPLKRAFLALEEAHARVAALEQAAREPIAIIGLGCRVPGGSNAERFWELMRDGVDAISRVPADRWDIDAYFNEDPEVPGKIATREGGFLEQIDGFDPGFFGIAPREAQGMDPQQRLMLEVAWEALEHAGLAPDRLQRSPTGVYMAVCSSDYTYLQVKTSDPTLLDAHFTSGIAHSIFSGRLSYLLGLQGPSLTIDTACSSSLVAVHLAVQALRARECRMAIAGGVNLILAPEIFIALSHSRMLAPDGRCKTFDAAANGFARGEGCGVVVLKRLADAVAEGDRVLAVIRGSAVNQDGPSSGLTAPNGPAQEAVIRAALADAGVVPRQVGYVEAHGTGTELGDPLEVHALGAVFGGDRQGTPPLVVGSVKTNIGHLEGAAGVTGLIKLALSLRHRTIPAHLHLRTPSPHIDWADVPLQVPVRSMPWAAIDGRRLGGVSSFGFSGTNAHVVVEEAPVHAELTPAQVRTCIFTLSARGSRALTELAERHYLALDGRREEELADLCYTVNHGRAHFAHRAAIVAHSIAELRSGLRALVDGASVPHLRIACVTRRDPLTVAFLYTGQGSQYTGMAYRLYETAPAFREALDRCARGLAAHLDRPLLSVMFPEAGADTPLDDTAYTQPALFAVEYALTELWRSWGVSPGVVLGHSVGEIAAACAAGVFDLDEALRLVATRGRLMQSLASGGAMAAIGASEHAVADAIRPYSSRVSVAAVNGPGQTVISGDAVAVAAVCDTLSGQGMRCQPLSVSHAFHSPLVEPILTAFEREVAKLRLSPPRVRLISNLTGQVATSDELTRPAYWRRHVRETVRFGDGLRAMEALRPDVAIEVGPHPTLLAFAGAAYGDAGPQRLASLRRGSDDWDHLLGTLASLYVAGASIDWRAQAATLDARLPRITDAPSYPFQRERCWFPANAVTPARSTEVPGTGHALLGSRVRSATAEAIYSSSIGTDAPAFIREHRVQGHVVLPATFYLDTLAALGRDVFRTDAIAIEDVIVTEAMVFADDGAARAVNVVCDPLLDGRRSVVISSQPMAAGADDSWVRHVTAHVRAATQGSWPRVDLASVERQCAAPVEREQFYAGFERRGLEFGDSFRSIRRLWAGHGEALGEIELSGHLAGAGGFLMHPVLLDGCVQVIAAAMPSEVDPDALYLPIGIGRYTLLRRAGMRCWSHVTMTAGSGDTSRADVRVFDDDGTLLGILERVQLKRVTRDALGRLGDRWLEDALYETRWRHAPLTAAAGTDMPSPEVLGDAAGARLDELSETAGIRAYDAFFGRFDALCGDFTVDALSRLGWHPQVGTRVQAAALAGELGVDPVHRLLFRRLLTILADIGLLDADPHAPGSWLVVKPLPRVDPLRALSLLRASCPPGAGAELEMTARVAEKLPEALRGSVEPMQLLFPGGSLETAERLYRDSPTARLFNGLMAEVLARVVAARGEGRPLRVLEIGAGTGGTTAHVLPRLEGEEVEYTFTDVGPMFVQNARERFGADGRVRFAVLDLERDPSEQGLAGQQFDVVIASNVIHATADLRRTLGRVRGVMAPGALLAMLEVTEPQRWFDLTVGLTSGWWAFTDSDLRPDYATLSRDGWVTLLPQCGFEQVVAVPDARRRQGSLARQSLLLARAAAVSVTARGAWLMFADGQGVVESLAAKLREHGDSCVLVRPGTFDHLGDEAHVDPDVPDDLRRLFARVRADHDTVVGVIHAWALDAPPWESTSIDELARAQRIGVLSAMRMAQALVAHTPPARLWLLTRGAQAVGASTGEVTPTHATIWGLGKALRLEHPELRAVCVDLEHDSAANRVEALMAELAEPGEEPQVALRSDGRYVARLARFRRPAAAPSTAAGTGAPWRLAPEASGSLEHIRQEPHRRRTPGPDEVEIAVEAAALNFKDVLNVLGMYPGDPGPLGGECAGRVTAVGSGVTHVGVGDAVMAVAAGSFASHAIARAELVQQRPAGVSAVEGAAFSIALPDGGVLSGPPRQPPAWAECADSCCGWRRRHGGGAPGTTRGRGSLRHGGVGLEARDAAVDGRQSRVRLAELRVRCRNTGCDGRARRGCRAQLADGRSDRRELCRRRGWRLFRGDRQTRNQDGRVGRRARARRPLPRRRLGADCRRRWAVDRPSLRLSVGAVPRGLDRGAPAPRVRVG